MFDQFQASAKAMIHGQNAPSSFESSSNLETCCLELQPYNLMDETGNFGTAHQLREGMKLVGMNVFLD